jgi:large subunit ribosomal protein L5
MQSRNMNLQQKYVKEIANDLKKELGVKNSMAVPMLSKIVINMGIKDALLDKKNIEKATEILTQIAGQKPKIMKAKKSISSFKLREGDKIGLSVTLRGKRMYDFFEKLTSVVLPRLRDFHGVRTTSFDKKGNYTLGFTESAVFPEIDPARVDRIQGLELTVVTTAKDDKEGLALLKALGMPFIKN